MEKGDSSRSIQPLRWNFGASHELAGWLAFSGFPGSSAVVYVHGFGSDCRGTKAMALEAACARRGWTMAAFSFRGHGESSGTMRDLCGSGLQTDLDQIRLALASRGIEQLFLVGSSMGGWVSAWYTLHHPREVQACVFLAPALRFLQLHWEKLDETQRALYLKTGRLRIQNEWLDVELGPGFLVEKDAFATAELQKAWTKPLLLFHGMKDETIPYQETLHWVEGLVAPEVELRLFRQGDHRLQDYKEEMAEEACRFFARWWPGA